MGNFLILILVLFWAFPVEAKEVYVFARLKDGVGIRSLQVIVDGRSVSLGALFFYQRYLFSVECVGEGGKKLDIRLKSDKSLCEDSLSLSIPSGVCGKVYAVDISFLKTGSCYKPYVFLSSRDSVLAKELLSVACRDAESLFLVRTDVNRVEASYPLERGALDVFVSSDVRESVVLLENGIVDFVSISPLRKIDSFKVPFVSNPSMMRVYLENKAVVADTVSGYVSVVSLETGALLAYRRFNFGVTYVDVSRDGKRIAVVVPAEHKVYVTSDSLLDEAIFRISGTPNAAKLDGDYLYVSNRSTGDVEVYRISTGVKVGSVYSGNGPGEIFDAGDKVYVANTGENSISVFDKSQYVLLRKIKLRGAPGRMASCTVRKWLYVALPDEKMVAVVDSVRDRVVGYIDVGCSVSALGTAVGEVSGCW